MPKPKGGPKDKKKKPKLTKAEKDKLKKEEAEQKAKEEEEARLLAEQAELERIEREKIEAEERRLLEERERVRHQAEIDELNKQLEENKQYLLDLKKSQLQKNKWSRYMLCDGRPDPTCKKEINSFINLTRENEKELGLEKVLKTCELILELIEELDRSIAQVSEEIIEIPECNSEEEQEKKPSESEIGVIGEEEESNEMSEEDNKDVEEKMNQKNALINFKSMIENCKESKQDLQDLINEKLNQATFALLKCPGQENIDPDDLNIQTCEQTRNVKVCLWGNAAKNPRIKQISFIKDAFTMELPKQMVVLDIALRVLYMNFDPFSFKSQYFYPKPEKKVDVPIIDIGVESAATMEHEEGGGQDGGLKPNNGMKSSLSIALSNKNALSTKDMGGRSGSRLGTAMSNTNSTRGGSKVPIAVEEPSKIEVSEPVEPIVEITNEDELVDDDVVDLRLFSPIGSLIYVDLLHLPPQPKEVGGWMMQQVVKGGLSKIPYKPAEEESTSDDSIKSSTTGSGSGSGSGSDSGTVVMNKKLSSNLLLSIDYNQPLALSVTVDEKVIFHEDPLIARWDETTQNWKLDGIGDTEYDGESRTLSFRTSFLGPFAVIQDKYLSLPFQAWHLRPKGLNECVLNLVSATIEVDIVIKEGECCAQFPEQVKEVSHISDKWMKPTQLIQALRSVGVNLFPYEDGHKYVKIYPKADALVVPLYQYMALLASCFSFMLSKWNTECGDEKVVVQALEWLRLQSSADSSHNLYYTTTRICYPLNINEEAEEFSKDVLPDSSMHPDLYHMLRNGASHAAKERIKDTSVVFIDCVHQLLSATNILVYS